MSKAADVAEAIETAVIAIPSLITAGFVVKRRKLPTLPDGQDPPQAVVSVAEEGDTEYLAFGGKVLIHYPAVVLLVTAGGKKLGDDDTLRGYRESVRKKVDDPTVFASVSQFHKVRSGGSSPFSPPALKQDYNYSLQTFTVTVVESRN